ncbi:hypothetical protein DPEC_G00362170 [Dallia pectoralis]|nr:hypothetical protein DPEC_G00362170 [Dallia pectoralis]
MEVSQEIVLHQSDSDSKDNMTIVTGYMNGQPQGDQWIRAQADRGSISLKTQSWFESLEVGQLRLQSSLPGLVPTLPTVIFPVFILYKVLKHPS